MTSTVKMRKVQVAAVADSELRTLLKTAASQPEDPLPYSTEVQQHVGFQNSATGPDLGFYAARSYSLMRPPRTGRRLIRS